MDILLSIGEVVVYVAVGFSLGYVLYFIITMIIESYVSEDFRELKERVEYLEKQVKSLTK